MLKRSVIAADITNLTDARYFASWGVDYLLFNISEVAIDEIKAILDWVDGVKPLILISKETGGQVEEAIMKLTPFGIGANESVVFDSLLKLEADCKYFFDFSNSKIQNTDPVLVLCDHQYIDSATLQVNPPIDAEVFTMAPNNPLNLNAILKEQRLGLVIKGSDELQTGLKSFEDVDVILETLSSYED